MRNLFTLILLAGFLAACGTTGYSHQTHYSVGQGSADLGDPAGEGAPSGDTGDGR